MSGPSKSEVMYLARAKFLTAADEYRQTINEATGEVLASKEDETLCRLADEYARARWAAATGAGRGTTAARGPKSTLALPFGRGKGKLLHEADKGDLTWVLGVVRESVDDPSKGKFREKNIELADAIEVELSTR